MGHTDRRWRQIVYGSPLRLHIQLRCKRGTPVRTHLSCWPPFPIAIDFKDGLTRSDHEDNAIAALEKPNRVCRIVLLTTPWNLENLATVIQEPFPALTKLQLSLRYVDKNPVVIDGFLPVGGSPRLQELHLNAAYIQNLPALISHAHNLVTLHLGRMPSWSCIPPLSMAMCLSPLTKLKSLYIGFEKDNLFPDREGPATNTRIVLPALKSIGFNRVCGYVEDFVSGIDCPWLNDIHLWYHDHSSVDLRHPGSQIFKFINRSEDPHLTLFSGVVVERVIDGLDHGFELKFSHEAHTTIVFFFSKEIWGASHLAELVFQVLSQFSAKLSNVRYFSVRSWASIIGRTDWVHILRLFTNLRVLFVSRGSVEDIAPALDEETADELLPALDLLCLVDWPENCGAKFSEDRRLSGRPVTVVKTETELKERLRTYLRE
jgi:hypothetical protein